MSRDSLPTELPGRLDQGLAALDLDPDAEARERLISLIALLLKWNRAYNLSGIRDPLEMVPVHLLDSLAVADAVRGPRVLDVGTGAGFPGLPLAICARETRFVLLDSSRKKIRFVRQAALELGLDNVTAVHARVEDYRPGEAFDTVICRAFSALGQFVEMAGGQVNEDGRLLLMKGRHPRAELAECPPGWQLDELRPLRIPGLEGERHLVVLKRSAADG